MAKPRLTPFARALLGLALPGVALANPTGGHVVSGDITIGVPNPTTTVVDQASHTGIVNWQSFSVGSDEWVLFNLPNASSSILNRVVGGNPSEILGHLQSNGRVFLLNPNGVLFGRGASVDVGSLFTTTFGIEDRDFLSGNYAFTDRGATGGVENRGSIHVADGGFVVMTAAEVANRGLIQARLGDVHLASGSAVTMDLDGNGLVNLQVTKAALSEVAGVTNVGEIIADGGRVAMTARVARQLAGTVVNNQGLVRAQGVTEDGGAIYLTASGGDIVNGGTLDASGSGAGEVRLVGDAGVTLGESSQLLATSDHGVAEISGDRVRIRGDVQLGEYGSLYIDPTDLIVGEDASADLLASDLEALLRSGPSTSTVNVVASNSILFLDVAGNLIDGTKGGDGASLLVAIGSVDGSTFIQGAAGSIAFQDAADEIRVDGGIGFASGFFSGALDLGILTAHGPIGVVGADAVTTGNLTAAGPDGTVFVYSGGGSVSTGDVSGRKIELTAGNGIVQGGNVRSGAGGIQVTSSNDASDDVGGTVGGIVLGSATSSGGIVLLSDDAVETSPGLGIGVTVTGPVKARTNVTISTDSGDITLDDVKVDARGTDSGANVTLTAAAGRIAMGDLDILAGPVGAFGDINAAQDISVQGHSVVSAGGGSTTFDFVASPYIAGLNLVAGGVVQVTGPIRVAGEAVSSSFDGDGITGTTVEGGAFLAVGGTDVHFQSDVDVTGVGQAYATVLADGDVTIAGTTRVLATAATHDSSSVSNGTTHEIISRDGYAFLGITSDGAGLIATGDVEVSGPSAQVDIIGGRLRFGSATTEGDALNVAALEGGLETGTYYAVLENGVTLAESTLGVASTAIGGFDGSEGPGVIFNGNVTTTGPVVKTRLFGEGVTIAGSLTVRGTGFVREGEFASLVTPPGYFASAVPLINQGHLTWGSAELEVSGDDGLVSVSNVTVSGIGASTASIDGDSLSLGAVSVTALDGLVEGSYSTQETIDGSTYSALHRIDDGSGGPARFGGAHLVVEFSGASVTLDSLLMSGTDVEAMVDGPGSVTILGDVVLSGASAGSNPTVRERVSYQSELGPAIANTTTTINGGRVLFGVGFLGSTPSTFSSGDITMSGAGVTDLSIASSNTTIGAIDLSATSGSFVTNDVFHNSGVDPGETIDDGLGHVFVAIGSPNSPASIESLTVDAAGDAFVGVQANASGDVAIAAAGALRGAAPDELVALQNPVQRAFDGAGVGRGSGGRIVPKLDLPLQDTHLTGANVALDFGDDSAVGNLTLEASGTLTVNGHGAGLSAGGGTGNIKLDAVQALSINDAGLQGGTLQLAGSDVRLSHANLLGGDVLLIARNGSVTDQGQTFVIDADSLGVSATDAVLLTSGTMTVGTGETTIGGDAALRAALIALGLPVPDAANPNASFVGSNVAIGGLVLGGDYLFLQGDQVAAGFTAPNDLTLQFVPNTPTATLGLENAAGDHGDVNLNVTDNFPTLGGSTVIVGSTTYSGDILIGEDGPVTPVPGTNLVFVTNGTIVRPSSIQTDGTVTTIGTVVEPLLPDIVAPVQNDPVPTGQPEPPALPIPGTEAELIDQTTDTGPILVCT